jgi:hypothetical protein
MVNKTKMVIAGTALIASTGILIAATTKADDKDKEKNKKYQVISMKDGVLTEHDTIVSMSSTYTVESFLKDKNIEAENLDIIKIPMKGECDFVFFGDEDPHHGKKMIVKTEIITEDEIHSKGKDEEHSENIQIICKMDDDGKMTAKKIVNGKEVEMTQEEIDKMMKMHHSHEGNVKDVHKNIMIDIDIDGEDMEGFHTEMMEKMKIHLKDMDIDFDFDISEHMDMDSLIDAVHKKIAEAHGDDAEIKVVVKELKTEGGNDEDHMTKVIVMDGGEKIEWLSKDGNDVHVEMLHGEHEDFTIVIVTEDIEEENPKKSSKSVSNSDFDFSVFPNPTNGKFTLFFDQKKKANTSIDITDIQGKSVYSKNLGKFSGEYREEINLEEFGKGIYIVNIRTGKEKSSRKVILK